MVKKFIKISSLVSACALGFSLFTACSNGKAEGEQKTINVLNYGENIAEGLLEEFEEKYNIKVNYKTFDEMETMYIEVSSGKTNYDVVLVADYMADRMINEGLLQKINKENIPNLEQMSENDLGQPYDPNNDYTVPYMNGTIGIVYNKDLVSEPVDSWKVMFDEKYKGQIFILDSMRDAIGAAAKYLGYSLNTTDKNELEEIEKALLKQKDLLLTKGADNVMDIMRQGEAAVAMIWSGEGLNLSEEYDNLEYVIPKEGANYWLDSWAIPANAKDKESAEKFINFLSEKDNALRIADEIGYTSPNKLAIEEQPDEVKNNPAAYLSEELMSKCEVYKYMKPEELKLYEELWLRVYAQ